MSNIGTKIKTMRMSRDMSQQQLAEASNVSRSAIGMWETGEREPNLDMLDVLADVFNVPLSFLLDDASKTTTNNDFIHINSFLAHRVPILGSIAAGVPILAEQNFDGYVDSPDKADFALLVKGDSMTPTFQDGDYAYIRIQPTVDDGQIAAVVIDGEATLKHVYRDKYGINLVAENTAYPPIRIDPSEHEDIRIAGLAVGLNRMFRRDKAADVHKGIK